MRRRGGPRGRGQLDRLDQARGAVAAGGGWAQGRGRAADLAWLPQAGARGRGATNGGVWGRACASAAPAQASAGQPAPSIWAVHATSDLAPPYPTPRPALHRAQLQAPLRAPVASLAITRAPLPPRRERSGLVPAHEPLKAGAPVRCVVAAGADASVAVLDAATGYYLSKCAGASGRVPRPCAVPPCACGSPSCISHGRTGGGARTWRVPACRRTQICGWAWRLLPSQALLAVRVWV